jgi:hypothetical protein
MEDGIDALAGLGDGRKVEQVAEHQLEARGGAGMVEKFALSRYVVINADNFVAIRKQAVDRLTTQKPGRAGD